MANSYFTPRRRSPSQHISLQINGPTIRGLAIARDIVSGSVSALADSDAGREAIGFLFREVTATGPDVVQSVQAWGTDAFTHELEQPDKAGGQGTIELLEKFECEGPLYILASGTNSIVSSSPLGSKIGFTLGRACLLPSGKVDTGWRLGELLTAEDSGNSTRAVIEKVF